MSRKLYEACIFNVHCEISQSNRGIPVAIMALSNLPNYPWVVPLQCTFLMMTSRQSGSPIGVDGNSQTMHGSIVVEFKINDLLEGYEVVIVIQYSNASFVIFAIARSNVDS